MPDMLVSLVQLPPITPLLEELREQGIYVRRPNPWELSEVREFIEKHFSRSWADEVSVGFANKPVSVFVARHEDQIVGFAAYECTRRNYFGPTGVAEAYRGRGIGTALLLACLYAMQDMGYVYAIIGGAGPMEFYSKACGAVPIPFDEGRGMYKMEEEPRFRPH